MIKAVQNFQTVHNTLFSVRYLTVLSTNMINPNYRRIKMSVLSELA